MACVGETDASHFLDVAYQEKVKQKSTKKLAKNLKKGVDIKNWLWYYIQVDAIRQQNISQGR